MTSLGLTVGSGSRETESKSSSTSQPPGFMAVPHCGSVPVHHTHQSLPQKMQSSESSGDNLRLSVTCSAPFSEPMVVKQPQFTRVDEPALLCNHVPARYENRNPEMPFCLTART